MSNVVSWFLLFFSNITSQTPQSVVHVDSLSIFQNHIINNDDTKLNGTKHRRLQIKTYETMQGRAKRNCNLLWKCISLIKNKYSIEQKKKKEKETYPKWIVNMTVTTNHWKRQTLCRHENFFLIICNPSTVGKIRSWKLRTTMKLETVLVENCKQINSISMCLNSVCNLLNTKR